MNDVDKRFDQYFSGDFGYNIKDAVKPLLAQKIKSFIREEIKLALESVVPEKLEEHEYDYCDNDFCFNDCIDQINSNIKEYLKEEK